MGGWVGGGGGCPQSAGQSILALSHSQISKPTAVIIETLASP